MKRIALIIIFIFGLLLRLYGINWDSGYYFHPDERFLAMVADQLTWPASIYEYFNTNISPMNPHNKGFDFYVYGTFPLIVTKAVATIINMDTYGGFALVGRTLTAILDASIIILVYLLALLILKQHSTAIISAFIYAISVLPIQLSHFFAVDPFLMFSTTLTIFLLVSILKEVGKHRKLVVEQHLQNTVTQVNWKIVGLTLLLGITFALAIASKVSAIIFLPIISCGFILLLFKLQDFVQWLLLVMLFLVVCVLFVRICYPYIFIGTFTINQKVINNFKQLKAFDGVDTSFPPGIQWIKTTSYVHPFLNLVLFGLGVPLGILVIIGFIYLHILTLKDRNIAILVILAIIWMIFLYQGAQFAKAMRYFYPIFPYLAICGGVAFDLVTKKLPKRISWFRSWYKLCILVLISIWPMSFMHIYKIPHSRVSAGHWMEEHVPNGSTVAYEHWDDALPVHKISVTAISYPLYDPDTIEKYTALADTVNKTDYIILTSNRLYGSITSVPDRYPMATLYYQKLFNGSLGFEKVAEFTSRPYFPIPGIKSCILIPGSNYGVIARSIEECQFAGLSIVDDYSEEFFTVYDHPKVLIFKKSPHFKNLTYSTFYPL